jgi:hypothetical protein
MSNSAGYCLLTLQIAVWALQWSVRTDKFTVDGYPDIIFNRRERSVLGWLALVGYDADTYCATAGPLLVAKHGPIIAGLSKHLQVTGLWKEMLKIDEESSDGVS